VIFTDSSRTSVLSGNTTFYDLTITAAGKTVTGTAGSTQTVSSGGTLTIMGRPEAP
jgi:hypothetical protein